MNYPCPQCDAGTELDPSSLPEETSTTCGECKSRLWIYRESFAKRAFRKEGTIFCSHCSNPLDDLIVCRSCGTRCPEYILIQRTKIVRKKSRSGRRLISISTSRRDSRAASTRAEGFRTTDEEGSKPGKKNLRALVCLIVLVAVAIGGYSFYSNAKQERQYRANFFRALYGMKAGSEVGIGKCSKIATEWKAKIDAGQAVDGGMLFADDADLGKTQRGVDKIRQEMQPPPKRFQALDGKLVRLYNSFARIMALAVTPSTSLPAFTDTVGKAEAEYRQALQEVKTAIPAAELSEDLKAAKAKYRDLRDF